MSEPEETKTTAVAMTSEQTLPGYGDRAEIQEMATRITNMLPGAKEIGPVGALALAQVARSLGLNPFIGEIWAIPSSKGPSAGSTQSICSGWGHVHVPLSPPDRRGDGRHHLAAG